MTREEFNKLIDRYLSGQASPAEEKLIDDFFESLERKQTLPHYKLSGEMWASIEREVRPGAEDDAEINETMRTTRKRFSIRKVLVPLLFVLAAGLVFYLRETSPTGVSRAWVISEAPKGQKSLITLADGSRIFLNSASSISYPETFDSDKREVMLEGEAFFEVARNEKKPFVVRSGNVVTRVLGTSFNIEAFKGETTRVTVATGKVQVGAASQTDGRHAREVVLTPGEQAVYDEEQGLSARKVATEQVFAWKNHTLYFDNRTLEEVAADLERWYNVSIEFENEPIKNCRVNGQYKEMDLRSVLESIRYMYPVKYKFSDQNHVILYGEGCDQ